MAGSDAQIRVRLFAALREAAGWRERLVIPEQGNATPLELWRQLGLGTPRCSSLPAGVRVAINQQFASADRPLADGDEVAFLPPITGG
ncbi:MAG: MoaD/ThiS family protein [Cyanobium sp.]